MPIPLPTAVPTCATLAVPLAQAAPPPGGEPPDALRTLVNTLPIALIVAAAYLFLFRPEREKQRRQQAVLAGLKKNDRVITSAGIHGTVANVDQSTDRVTLRIDDTAKLTVTLSSIVRVLSDKPTAEHTAQD